MAAVLCAKCGEERKNKRHGGFTGHAFQVPCRAAGCGKAKGDKVHRPAPKNAGSERLDHHKFTVGW